MEPRFHVGDIVHIVDEPVELEVSWVSTMDQYCGREVEIKDAWMRPDGLGGRYFLFGIPFTWNDEAFQEFYEEIKPPIAENDLLTLLNG